MKKYYVYELYDELGSIRYVGYSSNPEYRLYQHTKKKPESGHGKFYGWKMDMEIVGEFEDRKEAAKYEGERKKYWGMEWTEQTNAINNGKKLGKLAVDSGQWEQVKHLGIPASNEVTSKAVLAYKLNGEFVGKYKSQREAARVLEVQQTHVCQVVNGRKKQTGGYIFKEA